MLQASSRRVVLALITGTLAIVTTSGAASASAAGEQYGQHVRACAQSMGFNADHNPGLHQGFHGWDPSHTC